MSKGRSPWFWNTAVLVWLVLMLLTIVLTGYATRAVDWYRHSSKQNNPVPNTLIVQMAEIPIAPLSKSGAELRRIGLL
jgi:hypothetical protein